MLSVAARTRLGSFVLDLEFELPTPGVVALFGRSGCGKSTVIDIIAGLREPQFGQVRLDGVVLVDTDQKVNVPTERRGVGYVFQDARLFPHLTVSGNLRYAAHRAIGPVYVTVESVVTLLGLESLMERRTHQLSGGESQRIAIARALLTQPRLLLLDEPLASVDRSRRAEVLPYLEKLRDQLAIPMVYVTHDFDEVLRLATHVVLMEAGRVVTQGEVSTMSLDPRLRSLIGPDSVGAIVNGIVTGVDPTSRLTQVRVGEGEINVQTAALGVGTVLRVQLLARDIIVSTLEPHHLSVRNSLAGVIHEISDDDADSDLVTIDIGGPLIMARITKAATRELALGQGTRVWALVKSVSLRDRSFAAPTLAASPHA